MIGTTLSHFKITAKLGEGGMGEVYRAEDTKLERQVAIKLLPEEFAAHPDRLSRLVREAQVLASLNHPNIAAIYDLVEDGDTRFLVMELAPGEDLATHLSHGPLPLEEALSIALQIAEALEAAHEKGIVHRDLKPANIKITPGGSIKVLDFGLAKTTARPPAETATSSAPTLTAETEPGVILGTVTHMSPEQARGQAVDKQTDIWAFGVVLWQLLTGEPPFRGETVSDILAAVLTSDPDWQAIPSHLPTDLQRILRRCLERDRRERFHDIADIRIELADLLGRATDKAPEDEAKNRTPSEAPTVRMFRLTAEICRKFDRQSLDPRVIGDHMQFLDNGRSSDVLVCFLPGMGLDHRIFEETLARSPYRGLATTSYGCEPASERRIAMAWPDQLILLEQFLSDAMARLDPEIVILAGFSLGADAALRLLVETDIDPSRIDGILSLGCNLNLETCVFSSRLVEVTSATSDEILVPLRAISESATTLDDWIQVHRYLTEVVSKYQSNFAVLRSAAEAVVEPFLDPTRRSFAEWYRHAREHDTAVRCVVADTEHERDALRQLRIEHLDDDILGREFQDDDILIEPGLSHFDLLDPEVIERHLESLIREVRSKRAARRD